MDVDKVGNGPRVVAGSEVLWCEHQNTELSAFFARSVTSQNEFPRTVLGSLGLTEAGEAWL